MQQLDDVLDHLYFNIEWKTYLFIIAFLCWVQNALAEIMPINRVRFKINLIPRACLSPLILVYA